MGRKTFDSLGKALPNRKNIVITRDTDYQNDTVFVVNSLKEALDNCLDDPQPFIIGGAQIYKQAINLADKLDLTFVHHSFNADVFFPEIDTSIWKEVSRENFKADSKNDYDYSFVTFERI